MSTETPQKTLTAITLDVGKLTAYKSVADKLETLIPQTKAGTISPAQLLTELLDHLTGEMEKLQ
jgi:hypothetical protein